MRDNLLLKEPWFPQHGGLVETHFSSEIKNPPFSNDIHSQSVQATKAADSQFLSLLTPRWPLTPPTECDSSKPPHRSFLNFPLYLSSSTSHSPSFHLSLSHTHTHKAGVSSTYQSLSSILSKTDSVHRCVRACVHAHSVERTQCEVERASMICVGKCVFPTMCV